MSAIGEILKYAMIEETVAKNSDYEMGPTPLIDVLEKIIKDGFDIEDPGISGLITSCIKMKLYIVARDPREANLRRILNLGHTVGHALEKVGDFKLSHGEAVGIGLVQTTKLSVAQKRIEKAAVERVKEILIRAELPHELPKGSNKEELVSTMAHDKKRHGENIKLVLPHTRLGMVDYEVSYPIADLNKLL
jgi:3-dehydroquinate synthase